MPNGPFPWNCKQIWILRHFRPPGPALTASGSSGDRPPCFLDRKSMRQTQEFLMHRMNQGRSFFFANLTGYLQEFLWGHFCHRSVCDLFYFCLFLQFSDKKLQVSVRKIGMKCIYIFRLN